jgi:hypothetical protein
LSTTLLPSDGESTRWTTTKCNDSASRFQQHSTLAGS